MAQKRPRSDSFNLLGMPTGPAVAPPQARPMASAASGYTSTTAARGSLGMPGSGSTTTVTKHNGTTTTTKLTVARDNVRHFPKSASSLVQKEKCVGVVVFVLAYVCRGMRVHARCCRRRRHSRVAHQRAPQCAMCLCGWGVRVRTCCEVNDTHTDVTLAVGWPCQVSYGKHDARPVGAL